MREVYEGQNLNVRMKGTNRTEIGKVRCINGRLMVCVERKGSQVQIGLDVAHELYELSIIE